MTAWPTGDQTTWSGQLWPAGMPPVHPDTVNSFPPPPPLGPACRASGALPVFVTTSSCGGLDVPTCCDANFNAAGANVMIGLATPVP